MKFLRTLLFYSFFICTTFSLNATCLQAATHKIKPSKVVSILKKARGFESLLSHITKLFEQGDQVVVELSDGGVSIPLLHFLLSDTEEFKSAAPKGKGALKKQRTALIQYFIEKLKEGEAQNHFIARSFRDISRSNLAHRLAIFGDVNLARRLLRMPRDYDLLVVHDIYFAEDSDNDGVEDFLDMALDAHGRTPLLVSAMHRRHKMIFDYFLNRGANLQSVDFDGNNVFHLAAQAGAASMIDAASHRYEFSPRQDGGVHLYNHVNARRQTPLMLAVMAGNLQTVEALLRLPNIDLHVQDLERNTALTLAMDAGNIDIIEAIGEQEEESSRIRRRDLAILHGLHAGRGEGKGEGEGEGEGEGKGEGEGEGEGPISPSTVALASLIADFATTPPEGARTPTPSRSIARSGDDSSAASDLWSFASTDDGAVSDAEDEALAIALERSLSLEVTGGEDLTVRNLGSDFDAAAGSDEDDEDVRSFITDQSAFDIIRSHPQ